MTPLHWACLNGFASAVSLLLEQDPMCVNEDCGDGMTPLFLSAMGGHDTVARLLLDHGADLRMTCFNGTTPSAIAKEKGYKALSLWLRQCETYCKKVTAWNPLDFTDWEPNSEIEK